MGEKKSKKHSKAQKIVWGVVLSLIIAILVGGAAFFAYNNLDLFNNKANNLDDSAKKNVSDYSFSSCGDEFVDMYVGSVYGADDYAEAVSEYAIAARQVPGYKDDIDCVYISFEGYFYAKDSEGSRSEFVTFSALSKEQSVNSKITSFTSEDDMNVLVSGLEHNEQLEGEGGSIDGRG